MPPLLRPSRRPCWVVNLISYCLFVTDRMIAMSFPSSGKTSMYRNPISVGFLHSFFVEILSAYMIWINDLVAKYQSFLYIFTIFTKVSLFNHQKSLNRLVHQYFIHFRKLQDFSTQNTLAITRFITCVVSNSPVIFLTLKDDKYRLFSIHWSILYHFSSLISRWAPLWNTLVQRQRGKSPHWWP